MVSEATIVPASGALDPALVGEFAMHIRGPIVQPGDPSYDEVRSVRNGLIDRKPAIVIQCSGVADVVAAVNFARDNDLLLSVRGGGHNVAGNAVNDGGLVIDLSLMRGVYIDSAAQTARVQGGATWGDVDGEAQLFGLATPGGVISSTGVAGLTLHGGWGWLRRKYGYCIDNLLAADIVTADGQVRTASEIENPDLFWAIRGAGSNFGVVTSFLFKLHPIAPTVSLAGAAYSIDDAEKVLPAWRDFAETAPDEISTSVLMWSVPPAEMFPPELHGKSVIIPAAVHCGPAEVAEEALMPLRSLATPVIDLSGSMPYAHLQTGFDWAFPKGWLYYWKSHYVDRLDDASLKVIIERARQRPTTQALMAIWHLGGAASRVPANATAFGSRNSPYLLSYDTTWTDPSDTDRCMAWTRDSWAETRTLGSGGIYLNFAGFGEEKEALVRAGYGENYDRLTSLKAKYDPTNLFRMNQNIKPAAS